ncbi:DUF4279 domain-containing protein [Sphingorhabdus sp. M41]|uniref:DUF4279 domain-containing protein n=1 Tax=Sphingorhabdus sp. M41 TaxID=1806885 RepID=UPI00078D85B6|nr:hypothetical protein AZE99_11265 [Sphingorhabdus sp. M41]
MGTVSETSVGLRFFGDDLNPDEITIKLGCEATIGVQKGGTWLTAKGATKIARTGSWRRHTPRLSPGDLDRQIELLLSQMSDDLGIWNDLTSRFQADIFTGLFLKDQNEGISLSPLTLVAIGSRGLKLDLDIYSSERE